MRLDCNFLKLHLNAPLPERGTFKNWRSSILALIGYSVGLGNFWKFPYLCYKYDGATFLIPYTVALFCIGIPLYFMELALGQYVSLAPTHLFTFMSPIFSGVGYGMVLILLAIVIYYNVIIAWTVYYIGVTAAFSSPEPWASCKDANKSVIACPDNTKSLIAAAKDYYEDEVLGLPSEGERSYELQMGMMFALALAWFLVAVCLAGGIRGTSRVLFFTVLYPYIILAFILAWSYDNYTIIYVNKARDAFFRLNTTLLLEHEIWHAAATQVIYSLGVAYGGIITLASYNKLHQNILRDTLIVCLLDTLTSVFCAYVVYNITGILSEDLLEEQGSSSTLVFIIFPALLSRMGTRGVWAMLFFIMILTLGFDSQLMMVETVTTALFDEFAVLRRRYIPVIAGSCFVMFLLGVPMTTRSGREIFDMLDAYTSSHSLLLLGFLEVIIVSYVYGFKGMMHIVKTELRIWIPAPFQYYLAGTLMFLTPLLLGVLLGVSLYSQVWSATGSSELLFVIGLIIAFSVFVIVPLRAIYVFFSRLYVEGFQFKNWPKLWRATTNFCPEFIRNGREPDMRNPNLPQGHFAMQNMHRDHVLADDD